MMKFTEISFNKSFKSETESGFDRCQKFVDSEVLRLSDPYVPMKTGMLKKSGISGTVIGSGVVEYTAPYAKRQYYTNSGTGQRGKLWFERMKADHKDEILKKAKENFA
ncbi:MAG: minor capsid protein [Ruminococcus sp.]|nr:minor capsid protein [Ruminococcus sp.]